ncbi:MAG: hypothetical protein ACLQU3_30050 [Limisphaerales bacterium]
MDNTLPNSGLGVDGEAAPQAFQFGFAAGPKDDIKPNERQRAEQED